MVRYCCCKHNYYFYLIVVIGIVAFLYFLLLNYDRYGNDGYDIKVEAYDFCNSIIDLIYKNNTYFCNYKDLWLPYRILYAPENFTCFNETIVVLINSKFDQFDVRSLIRLKWSSIFDIYDIRLLFIVGNSGIFETFNRLDNESQLFNDILLTSIIENYLNLTHKIYSALSWLSMHCRQSALTFKLDSDVIVDVNAFVDFCQQIIESQQFENKIYGHVMRGSIVRRDKSKKWFVPQSVFAPPIYPPYASGPAYVLGRNVPTRLINAVKYFNFMTVEDAFFTGIVAESTKIQLVDVDCLFTLYCDQRTCGYRRTHIAIHGCDGDSFI